MQSGTHPTLNHSKGFSHITLYLVLAYLLLPVYGTLFPFNEWLTPGASPLSLMWQHGLSNTSKADILTNLLVYLPFGLLLMRTLGTRRCSLCMVLLVTLASALLSLTLEYLQAHLPGRAPSVADVVLNTSGEMSLASFHQNLRFTQNTAP
jgi:VanZ family protein